jgi:RNA polymerase sigma-70 factor (ECF subfamily)
MSDPITRSLDLVLRAQQGDTDALNRLIERYYAKVQRMVRLRLGPRLREKVESGDILQETFIAAVRSLDSFEMREEASLIQWLSRLAERQIIAAADYHGAKKRDSRKEASLQGAEDSGASATVKFEFADEKSLQPFDLVAGSEEQARVEACLATLTEEYRELILLRNYAGMSWESIAEETGRPSPAAARMMHARALVELGKLLRGPGSDDGHAGAAVQS